MFINYKHASTYTHTHTHKHTHRPIYIYTYIYRHIYIGIYIYIYIYAFIYKEEIYKISRASMSFGRLSDRAWKQHGIKLDTKIHVYKAVVLSNLLYGCET